MAVQRSKLVKGQMIKGVFINSKNRGTVVDGPKDRYDRPLHVTPHYLIKWNDKDVATWVPRADLDANI